MSTLATVGGVVGGGAIAGTAVLVAAPVAIAAAAGFGVYKFFGGGKRKTTTSESACQMNYPERCAAEAIRRSKRLAPLTKSLPAASDQHAVPTAFHLPARRASRSACCVDVAVAVATGVSLRTNRIATGWR